MSTTLDDQVTRSPAASAERLRTTMAAMRVSFTWFGTRKTLTPAQKAVAAESFGAAGKYLSAGKKLIDTQHPSFKAVTTVRNRCLAFWKSVSLPYPEPGIRLVRQDALEMVEQHLATCQADLAAAVEQLGRHFSELQAAARSRLGDLYCEQDYPTSLDGLFAVTWDYPSLEPPSYLAQLNPARYQEECQRVAARFDEAVELAEQAFLDELTHLVTHLTERLSGTVDRTPKIFRDSAVGNLHDFFERFRTLNVRSNAQLDELVTQCQQIVEGVEPQRLRDNQMLRRHVATHLSTVQSVLDGLLVDRPRRRILRNAK
ncbi:MAG: hypothetical protein ACYC0X_07825 [Pirellulaceae bacterium]